MSTHYQKLGTQISNNTKSDFILKWSLETLKSELQQEMKSKSIETQVSSSNVIFLPNKSSSIHPEPSPATVSRKNSPLIKYSFENGALYNGGNLLGSEVYTAAKEFKGGGITERQWQSSYLNLNDEIEDQTWCYVTNPETDPTEKIKSQDVLGRFAYRIYDLSGTINVNQLYSPASPTRSVWASSLIRRIQFPLLGQWRSWLFPDQELQSSTLNRTLFQYPSCISNQSRQLLSRSELIQASLDENAPLRSKEMLQNLTHWNRSITSPSWYPTKNATDYGAPNNGASDNFAYAQNREKEKSINRNILTHRASEDFQIYHYLADASRITVSFKKGDPLLRYRFGLDKLQWIGWNGPSHDVMKGVQGETAESVIQKCFGLRWNAGANPDPCWEYVGDTSTVQRRILRLDEVIDREPNFFELLKAGILNGSLGLGSKPGSGNCLGTGAHPAYHRGTNSLVWGDNSVNFDSLPDYQILQIGANLIDQVDEDSYPTVLRMNAIFGTPKIARPLDFLGIEDLPLIYKTYFSYFRPEAGTAVYQAQSQGGITAIQENYRSTVRSWLRFELWNPHQIAASKTGSPPNCRIIYSGYSNGAMGPGGARFHLNLQTGNNGTGLIAVSGETGFAAWKGATTLPTSQWGITGNATRPAPESQPRLGEILGPNTTANPSISFSPSFSDFRNPSEISLTSGNESQPQMRYTSSFTTPMGVISFLGFWCGDLYMPFRFLSTSGAATDINPLNTPDGIGFRYVPSFTVTLPTGPATYSNMIMRPLSVPATGFSGAALPSALEINMQVDTTAGSTFNLQIQTPEGWRTYQRIRNILRPNTSGLNNEILDLQVTRNPGVAVSAVNVHASTTQSWCGSIDPRDNRFGLFSGDFSSASTSQNTQNLTAHSENPAVYQFGWKAGPTDNLADNSGYSNSESHFDPQLTSAAPFPKLGSYLENSAEFGQSTTIKYAADQNLSRINCNYRDLDLVQRRGDGDPTLKYRAFYQSENGNKARPIVLNRPFQNVGEMAYTYRDDPWRTLDFSSSRSADAALLDFFAVSDEPEISDRLLNPTAVSDQILPSLFEGSTLKTLAGVNLAETQASEMTKILKGSTLNIQNRADLVEVLGKTLENEKSVISSNTHTSSLGEETHFIKTQRESFTRVLSQVAQFRTWTLMIDIFAQSGSKPPKSDSLERFDVQGQKRAWVFLSIDRFTGRIVDEKWEYP